MQIHDVEQGTPEWRQARCGIITASNMSSVLAKGEGKTRMGLMHDMMGEIITGKPASSYSNKHMERGKEWEPEAIELYEITKGVTATIVGFVTNDFPCGRVGASPDFLVGDTGGGEIKTKLPRLQIELLFADRVPPEHKAQIQTNLWVCEREYYDFCSYCEGMPLFIKRVERDEPYIVNMATEVAAFYAEMQEKLAKIGAMA